MALTPEKLKRMQDIAARVGTGSASSVGVRPPGGSGGSVGSSLLKGASDIAERGLSAAAGVFTDPIGRALLTPSATLRGKTLNTPFGQVKPMDIAGGTKFAVTKESLKSGEALQSAAEVATTFPGVTTKLGALVGAKVGPRLVARAERLYQSALKPSKAILRTAPDVVKTGLKEGIGVSQRGLQKANTIIDTIGEDIGNVIERGIASGKGVVKKDLLPYLDELKEYYSNVLGGEKMLKEVDSFAKEALEQLPETIPIQQAQKLKQSTQRWLAESYGKFMPRSVEQETRKRLTRGLKEGIAEQVPEIAALNARDSKLLGLQDALDDALRRVGNREIVGLTDMASLGAGTVMDLAGGGGVRTATVALPLIRRLIDNPSLKAWRAIQYNKMGKNAVNLLRAGSFGGAIAAVKLMQLLRGKNEEER